MHLAGENRPISDDAFEQVNVGLTRRLCDAISESGRAIPLLFANALLTSISRGVAQTLDEQAVGMLAESIEKQRRG